MATWAGVLTVAFLAFRGDDLGQLPALAGAFVADLRARPVLGLAGLGRTLAGLVLAGAIVLAWLGLGTLLLRSPRSVPRGSRSRALELAERCALGAGAWSLAWFFLGTAGLYRTPVAVLALLAGVALGGVALAREPRTRSARDPEAGPVSPIARAAAVLVLITLGLALVAALAPPTIKDTLLYHLAIPKAYVAAGSRIEVVGNMAGYYPLGLEMHAVWALLLGGGGDPRRVGEAAAGALAFAWLPLLLAITAGWARERGLDRLPALVGALLVAAIPTVYHVASSGYVDLALASYVALAVRAAGRWWTSPEAGCLRRLALALGWALCIKLTAAFVVLPLGAMVLARTWRAPRSRVAILARALAAFAVAGVLASPWYVSTWARTGSPVFPFYVDVWPGHAPGWDVERSYQYEALFARYGRVDTSALDRVLPEADAASGHAARAILRVLIAPVRLAVAAQPEVDTHYDGVLGVAMLFGLPLVGLALVRRALDVEVRVAVAASATFFVAWLLGSQQLRYLVPATPGWVLAVMASGGVLVPIARRVLHASLVGMAAAGVLVIAAWFAEQAPLRVVLGGEGRERYLARRLDYYPYYEIVNRQLPPGARVWLINMRRDTYHLERAYFSDYIFEDWTLRQWVRAARDADDIRGRARAAGLTHVLVRHDLLFDYARTPIVDDRRPPGENVARLGLLASFFRDGTRLIRADGKFLLAELRAEGTGPLLDKARRPRP